MCAASTTTLPQGTHTVGGVTTVVTTATTVVCPVATTKTTGGVVTSVIETTTYVCPSAGTYTIALDHRDGHRYRIRLPGPGRHQLHPGTYTATAVTTVVETDTVIYCPFTEVTPTPAPPLSRLLLPRPLPAPAPSSAAPSIDSPSGLGGAPGQHWGVTYTLTVMTVPASLPRRS